jgi:hypothetical protein
MTAPGVSIDTAERPPKEAICRAAEDERAACCFAGTCPERAQRVAHYANPPMRGSRCWRFLRLSDPAARDALPGARHWAVVCWNCGANYTTEYLSGMELQWEGKPITVNAIVCPVCIRPKVVSA